MAGAPKELTDKQGRSLLSPSSVFPPSQLISEMLARQKESLWLTYALLEGCQQEPQSLAHEEGNKALGFHGLQKRCSVRQPSPIMLRPIVTLLLF